MRSFRLQNDCKDCDAMLPSCLEIREIQMTISSEGKATQIYKNVPLHWACCRPLTVILPFSCTGWNVTIAESLGVNVCQFHSKVEKVSLNGQEVEFEGEFSRSGIRDFAVLTLHKPFSCYCKLLIQFHRHAGMLLTWGEIAVDVGNGN